MRTNCAQELTATSVTKPRRDTARRVLFVTPSQVVGPGYQFNRRDNQHGTELPCPYHKHTVGLLVAPSSKKFSTLGRHTACLDHFATSTQVMTVNIAFHTGRRDRREGTALPCPNR